MAAGASYAWAMNITPAPISRHVSAPEAMLVRALLDISDSKFSSAFDQHRQPAHGQSEFPAGATGQGRPAAFAHATDQIHRQRVRRFRRTGCGIARRSARAPGAFADRPVAGSGTALPVAVAGESKARPGARFDQVDAVRIREHGQDPALRRRLLRHHRQERHGEAARGRQEDAGRRVPRRQPAAERQAHGFLRQRRLSHQLSERVGPDARTQRPRHLAARHAARYLQPAAARERRLHRADQPGPGNACGETADRLDARS